MADDDLEQFFSHDTKHDDNEAQTVVAKAKKPRQSKKRKQDDNPADDAKPPTPKKPRQKKKTQPANEPVISAPIQNNGDVSVDTTSKKCKTGFKTKSSRNKNKTKKTSWMEQFSAWVRS